MLHCAAILCLKNPPLLITTPPDAIGWWFGVVLELRDLGTLQSLSRPWILRVPRQSRVKCEAIFWQLMLGWNWVMQQAMITSTAAKLQQTVCEKEQLRCNSPKSKPKQLKWYSGTLREFWINKYPRTSINLSNTVKNSGSKFLHNVRDLKSYRKWLLQVIAAKWLQAISYWIMEYTQFFIGLNKVLFFTMN